MADVTTTPGDHQKEGKDAPKGEHQPEAAQSTAAPLAKGDLGIVRAQNAAVTAAGAPGKDLPGVVLVGHPDALMPMRTTLANWQVRGVTAVPLDPHNAELQGSRLGSVLTGGADPIVRLPGGEVMVSPDVNALAEKLVHVHPNKPNYDVVVIGAGPAGLQATLGSAFEGWNTLNVGGDLIGGQARMTTGIRNLIGQSPEGVSGPELVSRALAQIAHEGKTVTDDEMRNLPPDEKAKRLQEQTGEVLVHTSVQSMSMNPDGNKTLKLSDGSEVTAKAVVFATGLTPRQLTGADGQPVPGINSFIGKQVFYGPSPYETDLEMGDDKMKQMAKDNIVGKDITIVGDANSAGQAAVNLARNGAHRVDVVSRNESLDDRNFLMSHSLKAQIAEINDAARQKDLAAGVKPEDIKAPIQIHFSSAVGSLRTDAENEAFKGVQLVQLGADKKPIADGKPQTVDADRMLIFVGNEPQGNFSDLAKTVRGYIKTGDQVPADKWPDASRKPMPLEVLPGVFAVGDAASNVRDRSQEGGPAQRMSVALGEGAEAAVQVGEYFRIRNQAAAASTSAARPDAAVAGDQDPDRIAQQLKLVSHAEGATSGQGGISDTTLAALKIVDPNTTDADLKLTDDERAALARRTPEEVFSDHLRLRAEGKLGADLVRNYDPNVRMVTNWGNFNGIDGVIKSATILGKNVPTRNYHFDRLVIDGDTAFEKWSADGNGMRVRNGIDAFTFKDGKIVAQTIDYVPEKVDGAASQSRADSGLKFGGMSDAGAPASDTHGVGQVANLIRQASAGDGIAMTQLHGLIARDGSVADPKTEVERFLGTYQAMTPDGRAYVEKLTQDRLNAIADAEAAKGRYSGAGTGLFVSGGVVLGAILGAVATAKTQIEAPERRAQAGLTSIRFGGQE